jgi:uncharacterized membrane protein YeaQ/YmgE (transglycosylase-associated protein family)
MTAASIHLDPGNFIAWIVVALLAGALAGRIVGGKGFGCIGNIAVGLVGAVIGSVVLSAFVNGNTTERFLGTLVVSLVGALILLVGLRLVRSVL